jgi:hypothetical protein
MQRNEVADCRRHDGVTSGSGLSSTAQHDEQPRQRRRHKSPARWHLAARTLLHHSRYLKLMLASQAAPRGRT